MEVVARARLRAQVTCHHRITDLPSLGSRSRHHSFAQRPKLPYFIDLARMPDSAAIFEPVVAA